MKGSYLGIVVAAILMALLTACAPPERKDPAAGESGEARNSTSLNTFA